MICIVPRATASPMPVARKAGGLDRVGGLPIYTPNGFTVRYQTLENGIYWIETDECKEILAVCYPIWYAELPGTAQKLGKITEYDKRAVSKRWKHRKGAAPKQL